MRLQTKFFLVCVSVFLVLVGNTNAERQVNHERPVLKSHYVSWGFDKDYSARCNRIAELMFRLPAHAPIMPRFHKLMSEGCFKPVLSKEYADYLKMMGQGG